MTKENIALVISVLAFGFSLFTFIFQLARNRRRLDIEISNVFLFGSESVGSEVFSIHIVNKSREAITISRLNVICGDRESGFGRYNKLISKYTETFKSKSTDQYWTSDSLPVKIEGLGFFSGLLISNDSHPILTEGTECVVVLSTNKGIMKSKYFFDKFSDRKLLKECRNPDS